MQKTSSKISRLFEHPEIILDSAIVPITKLTQAHEAFAVTQNQLVLAEQTHGHHVAIVDHEHGGSTIPRVDALITQTPGLSLGIKTADCVPVFLFDPVQSVVAAVHSGWKGTIAHIVKHTITAMAQNYGCEPENIRAHLGPRIGAGCYEVSEARDLRIQKFKAEFPQARVIIKKDLTTASHKAAAHNAPPPNTPPHDAPSHNTMTPRVYLDLKQAVIHDFLKAGLAKQHIDIDQTCTVCEHPALPSHYIEGKQRQNVIVSTIAKIPVIDYNANTHPVK